MSTSHKNCVACALGGGQTTWILSAGGGGCIRLRIVLLLAGVFCCANSVVVSVYSLVVNSTSCRLVGSVA
eukprot:7726588-Pyramimonas_sp.AAC.1